MYNMLSTSTTHHTYIIQYNLTLSRPDMQNKRLWWIQEDEEEETDSAAAQTSTADKTQHMRARVHAEIKALAAVETGSFAAAGPSAEAGPVAEEELAEEMQAATPCAKALQTDLKRKMLSICKEINSSIRTQRSDRDTRFFVQGLYNGPGVKDEEDGNVAVGDDIAVGFEPFVQGAKAGQPRIDLQLWFAEVQAMMAHRSGKLRTVHKLHLTEAPAEVRCKWYEPLMSRNKHVQYSGHYAYVLSVSEQYGFNDKLCHCTLSTK